MTSWNNLFLVLAILCVLFPLSKLVALILFYIWINLELFAEEDQQKENTAESETNEQREHEQRQTEPGEDIVKSECTSVVVYVSSFKESPKTDTNVVVCVVKESTDGRGVMV